ncbi:phospholipid/glycerol acyltransferase [Flammeovirgaceae bacterium 311]|nr:phospholipid/glycerol acyltransferase [Flammeovirgaceae bacterium 311]
MLVYRILKFLFRIAVSVFYREVYVQGRSLLPAQGPLIVAVNHPNTFMDPIVVALQLRQRSGFLANGGIFTNALLKWVFARLHLIPVYRPQDVKEGEKVDNTATFQKSHGYLLQGGTLMIFPEGSSVHEMKLRKLKTGTARIALETAAQKDFRSGLRISPVALTYSDPLFFGTRLSVVVSEPIAVDAYGDAYSADPMAAVQALTEHIRSSIQKNMVAAESKEHELLLKRIRKLYRDYLRDTSRKPLSKEDEFVMLQQIAAGIQYYEAEKPADYNRIQQRVNDYFNCLEQLELKEGLLAAGFTRYRKLLMFAGNLLLLVLFFPLCLLGLCTNYVPYKLPSIVEKSLGTDPEYRAGILMICGLIFFPLYYTLMCWLFIKFVSSHLLLLLLFIVALPVLGFFTLFYWRIVDSSAALFRYVSLSFNQQQLLHELSANRREILQELERAAAGLSASSK